MTTTHDTGSAEATVASDEADFKRGRSSMLWGVGFLVIVCAAGLWHLLGADDEARVYSELGRQINGLRQAHFDQFWDCALGGKNLRELKSNADLMNQLDRRAAERGRAYGLYLRDSCNPKLTDIEPTLDTLILPDDLKPDVDKLKAAASKLRAGLSALVSYLDNPELNYDSEAGHTYLEQITRGWFEFCQAHAAINKTLKAKLDAAH